MKISPYSDLAHDLEIQKAIVYLKAKNFSMAIETLKDFEKRDMKVASSAATNLSFLYFLVCCRRLSLCSSYFIFSNRLI